MKNPIKTTICIILSDFRWYRKKIGGKWYKIRHFEVSGFAAPGEIWVQELPSDNEYTLLGGEDYTKIGK